MKNKGIIKKSITIKLLIAISVMLIVGSFTGCTGKKKDNGKLSIVTTLFPQYDFAKQIVGDKGKVTLLLSPGMEAHSYDPTPKDIVKINESDLFIYTGENMETWAAKIIKSLEKDVDVLDASNGVSIIKTEDEEHSEDHDDEDHDHEEEEEHEGHHHVYDPHIWTSPVNAKIMINNILEEIVKIDPENKEYYEKNAKDYLDQITEIDTELRDVTSKADIKTLYFADKFAMYYFVHEYGLDYIAAFDSCTSESEPSAKLVAKIVDAVKEDQAPVIYYAELSNHKAADTISKETGTKELLLHSCHNVSKEDFDNGETYVSLMKQNIENLKQGLYRKK